MKYENKDKKKVNSFLKVNVTAQEKICKAVFKQKHFGN